MGSWLIAIRSRFWRIARASFESALTSVDTINDDLSIAHAAK